MAKKKDSSGVISSIELLNDLGLDQINFGYQAATVENTRPQSKAAKKTTKRITSYSPIDSQAIAQVEIATDIQYEQVISQAEAGFRQWRCVPAPKRGEIVRQIAIAMREHKQQLGQLISLEMGKILSEGLGEVQEAIDIADFAVGLSRQLCGSTMHSERAQHRMYEQWHPLGPIGVITAFNFPMAVWAWNAMIAAVCGDSVVWKPSELTPLCALALNKICSQVCEQNGYTGIFNLLIGDGPALGQRLAADRRLPLISATGSTRMGLAVGQTVAARLGRSILELGGNNAIIVLKDADLKLVIPAVLFGAVGTAGQRCTTTRRLLVAREIEKEVTEKLIHAYRQVRIGNPLDPATLMGPLISKTAVKNYENAIREARRSGAQVLYGGKCVPHMPSDLYVLPTLIKAKPELKILKQETFAPILYLTSVRDLEHAIALQNDVPQGLSSAIFTRDLKSAEKYLSVIGSDCGIANVNIGTSGAEIGGAFGGEKETGGGREAGSDCWKQYMRRQTNTINYSDTLPLAQGVKFDL